MEEPHETKKEHMARKRIRKILLVLACIAIFIGMFSTLTNPFSSFSIVSNDFTLGATADQIRYTQIAHIVLAENVFIRALADAKAGWHILTNRLAGGGKPSKAVTIESIIDSIHTLRFDPQKPFLISGDHFVELYPRSLGIFYHSLLDPRTARNPEDWQNRQKIYLKTTLFALETFKNTKFLATTIVPIGPHAVTTTNYFSPPSDTMYSLLFALSTLQSPKELTERYPYVIDENHYTLNTSESAARILTDYRNTLVRHYTTYLSQVIDQKTGLIRKDIYLSSTKDSVKRSSSFYDNVILWKTISLAQRLGIAPQDEQQLKTLKQKILSAFWLPDQKYFLDDLSPASVTNHNYSSDWLIAFMTGFLDPHSPEDQNYLTKGIQFISANHLDRPLALKYQPDSQEADLHWILRFLPSYGTHSLWSNWGMEYTKLLLRLYQETCTQSYVKEAEYQIKKYSDAITKYRGYMELYDDSGKPYQMPFYTTVYQTGWVVTFEQARAMLSSVTAHEPPSCTAENTDKIAF